MSELGLLLQHSLPPWQVSCVDFALLDPTLKSKGKDEVLLQLLIQLLLAQLLLLSSYSLNTLLLFCHCRCMRCGRSLQCSPPSASPTS